MSVSSSVTGVGLEKFGFRGLLINETFLNIYICGMAEILLGGAENPLSSNSK